MSFGFDVSFFWSRDSGVWFLIADFRFRISGFRFWVPGFVFQVSGFGLSFGLTSPHRAKQRAAPKLRHRRATFVEVKGLGFQGSRFKILGFFQGSRFRIQSLEFHVWLRT